MGDDTNSWCSLGFAEPTAVYKSGLQKARYLTEGWMAQHGFCPNCDADRLPALPNNAPVGDFRCPACAEEYELKATRAALGATLPAGAWSAMQTRLAAADNPSLFVMRYDAAANAVTDLIVVPRQFFTAAIVRPKTPTWPKGRSAPWQGSTILIGLVPDAGRIPLIRAGVPVPQAEVRDRWRSTLFLRDAAAPARGWLLAVMKAVEAVGRDAFTLEDVYAQEATLAALYPGNSNVRPKIRQQLQLLRDRGWLAFGDRRGTYRRV
ncbi:DpnI domain-containing protein [Brevundimonas sp.]|uniref:DpnI domain-containing protein n=1 Tax=Brevundimonas sp. TaxID=1871086 RepID=UPI002D47BC53|nr:DpnI domain-containing protein [Brevundimonas sp.]HYC74426.1 DpnI domain-containing protein [Brevundimonas sp.]